VRVKTFNNELLLNALTTKQISGNMSAFKKNSLQLATLGAILFRVLSDAKTFEMLVWHF